MHVMQVSLVRFEILGRIAAILPVIPERRVNGALTLQLCWGPFHKRGLIGFACLFFYFFNPSCSSMGSQM